MTQLDNADSLKKLGGLFQVGAKKEDEVKFLVAAKNIHNQSSGFLTWGLVGLGVALLAIIFEVSIVVFIPSIVILAVILLQVRALFDNEATDLTSHLKPDDFT